MNQKESKMRGIHKLLLHTSNILSIFLALSISFRLQRKTAKLSGTAGSLTSKLIACSYADFALSGSAKWVRATANSMKVCPRVGRRLIEADKKWKAWKLNYQIKPFIDYCKIRGRCSPMQIAAKSNGPDPNCTKFSSQKELNSWPSWGMLLLQHTSSCQRNTFLCYSTSAGIPESVGWLSCIWTMLHPNRDLLGPRILQP